MDLRTLRENFETAPPKGRRCRPFVFLTLFALLLSGSLSLAKAEVPMGDSQFKSLRIEYEINGEHQNGHETFVQKEKKTFRDTFIATKILYQKYEEHSLEIDDGVFFYRINLIDNTGIKIPSINKLKEQIIEANPHLYKTGQLPSPLRVTPAKGKLDKTETVQGRECAVYVSNNQLLYIWSDVVLKQVWEVVGKTTKEATKLELDGDVSDTAFDVPPGIRFQEPVNDSSDTSVPRLPADSSNGGASKSIAPDIAK